MTVWASEIPSWKRNSTGDILGVLTPDNYTVSLTNTLSNTVVLFGDSITGNCNVNNGTAYSNNAARDSFTYSTGTVSATNGSTAVTGTGTAWLTNLYSGASITIDSVVYTVAFVTSNTALTLTANFSGTTGSGKSYSATGRGMHQYKLQDIGYFNWANIILGNPFTVLYNSAIQGNTTAQMLARINTDVINYSPEWCVVMGGINDISTAVAADTIISNLTSIYTKLLAKGIKVIACTILPNNTVNSGGTTGKEALAKVNAFIKTFASRKSGIIAVDTFSSIYDATTTCGAVSGMFTDTTHPGTLGAYTIGNYMATQLSGYIKKNPAVVTSTADLCSTTYLNGNLVQYSVMNGTGGTNGGSTVATGTPPTGWLFQGSGDSVNCSVTHTKPARTDQVGTTRWRAVVAWTTLQAGVATFTHRITTAFALPAGITTGTLIDCEIEAIYSSVTNAGPLEFTFIFRDGAGSPNTVDTAVFTYGQSATTPTPAFNGVVAIRGIPVPPTATSAIVFVTGRNLAATNGGYTLELGNVVMRPRISV